MIHSDETGVHIFSSQLEGLGKNLATNFMRSLVWWRIWRLRLSHFALELPQPAVGAAEGPGGAALVAAILRNGATGDRPFHLAEEGRQ